jgi:hypothetical protein
MVPTLTHMYPVHTLMPYFFEIHFNISLPSMFRSSKWPLVGEEYNNEALLYAVFFQPLKI